MIFQLNLIQPLKREFASFFIAVSDAPKDDIIWTENGSMIDRFIPKIVTFKELGDRVQSYLQSSYYCKKNELKLSQFFKHQYL